MHIPTPTVLPDSTLAPAQIAAKFQNPTLAGLAGFGFVDGASAGDVTVDIPWDSEDLACTYGFEPSCGSGGVPVRGVGVDPAGSNGAGTDWTALIRQLVASGVDVAKIGIIKPGTTQTPGGISRQNPGYPVLPGAVGTGHPVSDVASSLSSAVVIGGVALLAVLMLSKNKG